MILTEKKPQTLRIERGSFLSFTLTSFLLDVHDKIDRSVVIESAAIGYRPFSVSELDGCYHVILGQNVESI